MKPIAALAASAALAAMFAPTGTAEAGPNNAIITKILGTRVNGEITLPKTGGALATFGCANVTVVATSRELTPHAPNEFSQPKWVRTANALSFEGGPCTYSMQVPSSQPFYLSAYGHGNFECTSIEVTLSQQGVLMSVPLATTRQVNLVASKITCEVLH